MDGPQDAFGFLAGVFHDVDLADIGPVAVFGILSVSAEVGPQHPECRPGAHPFGHLDTSLDPSVLELLQALGEQACGGEEGVLELFRPRLDHEQPILHPGVLRTVGVVLGLAVAPAPSADVVGPVRRIDRVTVELIVPYEVVTLRRFDRYRLRYGDRRRGGRRRGRGGFGGRRGWLFIDDRGAARATGARDQGERNQSKQGPMSSRLLPCHPSSFVSARTS